MLRIEDTDVSRNRREYLNAIYEGLRWLSLDWDEGPDRGGRYGPYLQSERGARHRDVAYELVRTGWAYECFCVSRALEETQNDDEEPDDGDASRILDRANSGKPSNPELLAKSPASAAGSLGRSDTSCSCGGLSEQARSERRKLGEPAIRFRVPKKRDFVVNDLVRGTVTFPGPTVSDFVIVTSVGRPLYNLGAAVDDHDMEISHVIRGEEHLANTPKQMLLYEAMGWQTPQFAHIPIILNAQRRKLSKRDGATSLNEYEAMGYVPDAVVNFLALLGWSPKDNRELLTRKELIALFDLDGVVKHPAIFDTSKLGWMNREYIKAMSPNELTARVLEFIRPANGDGRLSPQYVERVATLLHDRVRTVTEVLELGSYFFTDGSIAFSEEALAKYCATPESLSRLQEVRKALSAADGFDAPAVERAIRDLAAAKGIKASDYIHPLRVAVTGQAVSPGIFEVCSILGRERVLKRIDALVHFLSASLPKLKATQA